MKRIFYSFIYAMISIALCVFIVGFPQGKLIQTKGNHRKMSRLDHIFSPSDVIRHFDFNVNGSDVIVYVRIQKTGSTTFIERLSTDIDVSRFCKYSKLDKRFYHCESDWRDLVFLMRSKHDSPCGIHADWTHLQQCAGVMMDKRLGRHTSRRYLYITTLREPFQRLISEWQHVQRGATWNMVPLVCNGKSATKEEVPSCYSNYNWKNVDLESFLGCSSNLAINRQTRMLADLTLVNCYNMTTMTFDERHFKMLSSAKDNLRKMAYFGLMEYQELSQILFESTFNLNFISDVKRSNNSYADSVHISPNTREQILYLNKFDVLLYQFAKDLFFQRVETLIETTDNLELKRRLVTLSGNITMARE